MTQSHSPVYRKIVQEIRAKGPMTFRRYMELALYDPEGGYYMGEREKLGPGGDFVTSPEVSPLFGAAIAVQLREMWEILGRPEPFTVIEFGPGSGALAQSILGKAEEDGFGDALRYGLVETSPSLAAEQQKRLEGHPVFWLNEAGLPHGFTGVILTNEFLDALPVHRIVREDGELKEIYVGLDREDRLHDVTGPLSDPRLASYLPARGVDLAEGQEGEINLLAMEWLQTAAQTLGRGFVFTVDYGYPARELYAPHRKAGTLLGYRLHQAVTDPYLHVGTMDLTAHVDFSALKDCGEAAGLTTIGFTNQMWFLLSTGILKVLENRPPETAEELRLLSAIKKLLMPGGMGETFKILIQGKGVGNPDLLGLKETPRPGSKTWNL